MFFAALHGVSFCHVSLCNEKILFERGHLGKTGDGSHASGSGLHQFRVFDIIVRDIMKASNPIKSTNFPNRKHHFPQICSEGRPVAWKTISISNNSPQPRGKTYAPVDSMVKFGPGSGSTTSKRPQNGLGNPAIFFAFLSTTRKVLDILSLKPLPCFKRMCVLSTSRNHKIVVIGMFFRVSNIQQMAKPQIFGDFLDENNRWNRRSFVVQVMSSLTELQTRQSELMAQQAEMNRWFPQTGFGFQEGRFSPQKKCTTKTDKNQRLSRKNMLMEEIWNLADQLRLWVFLIFYYLQVFWVRVRWCSIVWIKSILTQCQS